MQHLHTMNNVNSYMNQQQEIMHSQFDQDDFLEQMLSSINPDPNSSASSFPWADDNHHTSNYNLEDQSTAVLASKMRQHQISNGAAKALMLQQQLMMSRDLLSDHNDVVDGSNFNQANDASVKPIFNGFTGSLQGQTSNQLQLFQAGAPPATNQAAASGSSGGGGAAVGQPRQRVRARRGQATDPHSIAERLRRERIAERMKALQELVPNGNKTDKASMLDEIIDYVKFLQLQVKVLSVSRLGGAGAASPLVGDMSSKGRNGNGPQTASSLNHNDGATTMAENQVVKMMEEDMGSAMQYLQGKGLCLMPISLATAISTATSHTRNPLNANANGPTSPSMSVLTAQSGANGGRESSLKDANSISKP